MRALRTVILSGLVAGSLAAASLAATAPPASAADVFDSVLSSGNPYDVAFSPDGTRAWTASTSTNVVQRIDTSTMSITGTYPVAGPASSVAVSPNGAIVGVGLENGNVTFLNASTGAVLNTQATGSLTRGVAFSLDGSRAFVINYNAQTVSVINTSTWVNLGNLPVQVGGTGMAPRSIAVDPTGTVWIGAGDRIFPLNPTTLAWGASVPFVDSPEGLRVSADGTTLYGVSISTDRLVAFDLASRTVVDSVEVGSDPADVTIAPGSDFVYTANAGDSTVSVVDARSFELVGSLPLPNQPLGIATSSRGDVYAVLPFAGRTVAIGTEAVRIAGADRFATAVAISQDAFSGTVDTVYVATGLNYPDALAAGPAAAHVGAPLLLTAPTSLPDNVRAEIVRLDPDEIIILGGTGAVSAAVATELEEIAPVERYDGATRYETARRIVREAFSISAGAYIATGQNFADALSAGAGGAAKDVPIILVDGAASGLDSETSDLLDSLGVEGVVVIGGTAAVSPGILADLSAYGPLRIAGSNRFETSMLFNRYLYGASSEAIFATGLNFPDALTGAAIAGDRDIPLFTTPPTCVPHDTLAELYSMNVARVTLLGGSATLSDAVGRLTAC